MLVVSKDRPLLTAAAPNILFAETSQPIDAPIEAVAIPPKKEYGEAGKFRFRGRLPVEDEVRAGSSPLDILELLLYRKVCHLGYR